MILLWWLLVAGLLVLLTNSFAHIKAYVRSIWVVIHLPGPFAWPVIGNAHWAVDTKSKYLPTIGTYLCTVG